MEPFDSRRAAAHAPHGMVASSQPLATQVGLHVLKDGGNAVDAAIAIAAMVNVTEPMMNGLGGDAFVLVHWQGKLHGLNASGRCPQAMTRDTFVNAGWTRMPQAGWGAVCVPGAPDGYFVLRERFGSKKFADLVEPAAAYAEDGFAVGQKVSHAWEWGASKLRLSDHSATEYLLQGRPPKPGEIFRQRNLARTWRELGKHGRDYYYAGDLARKIVAASDAGGGYLKSADRPAFRMDRPRLRDLPRSPRRGNAAQRPGPDRSDGLAYSGGMRHCRNFPE
jgi:gamma-glutamyltranspeptidase / glutathione hydrolase